MTNTVLIALTVDSQIKIYSQLCIIIISGDRVGDKDGGWGNGLGMGKTSDVRKECLMKDTRCQDRMKGGDLGLRI